MAKQVESLRVSEGNGRVVRLFGGPLIDACWIDDVDQKKQFLVVAYDTSLDAYVPGVEKLNMWDKPTYDKLTSEIDKREIELDQEKSEYKLERVSISREIIKAGKKTHYWTDNFDDADAEYRDLAKSECGISEPEYISTLPRN